MPCLVSSLYISKMLYHSYLFGSCSTSFITSGMTVINRDLKRRMVWAKLWLNRAEDETAFVDTNDTNTANDAKLPDPILLPSPESQHQQIEQKYDNVSGIATKDSNNNDGHANNDCEKSLISSPYPRPNIDIILSLKDPVYSSTMLGYFQLMGEKTTGSTTNEQGETLESVVAKKALLYFKRTSTTTTVRFFKLLSRNLVDGKFKEADEEAALRSEFILQYFQIIMCPYLFGSCSTSSFLYHFVHT